MKDILFLRHGNTFENYQTAVQIGSSQDPVLTLLGIEQITKVAVALYKTNIDIKYIYSSNLKRHDESAIIIKNYFPDAKIVYDNALIEIDYGLWGNLTTKEISEKWSKEYKEWTNNNIWQESIFLNNLNELIGNMNHWINNIKKNSIAITSQGIMKMILFHFCINNPAKKNSINTGHLSSLKVDKQKKIEILFWNKSPKVLMEEQ